MNTAAISFVMLSAAVLAVLSIFAAAIAVAANVLYEATEMHGELATRRALGARRSDIARMLVSRHVLAIVVGIVLGSLTVLTTNWIVVIGATVPVTLVALMGGWIAGRRAAKLPDSRSGRFRTMPDM